MDVDIAKIFAQKEEAGFWITLRDEGFKLSSYSIPKKLLPLIIYKTLNSFMEDQPDEEEDSDISGINLAFMGMGGSA